MVSAPESETEKMSDDKNNDTGFIYIIYNEMFKFYGANVFKIGKTKDIASYVKPVQVKFLSTLCTNCHLAEKLVSMKLNEHRMAHNREFFDVELDSAIACIEDVVAIVNADITETQEQLVICSICNGSYHRNNKYRHLSTFKHIHALQNNKCQEDRNDTD
jgi:hypothetical protein